MKQLKIPYAQRHRFTSKVRGQGLQALGDVDMLERLARYGQVVSCQVDEPLDRMAGKQLTREKHQVAG